MSSQPRQTVAAATGMNLVRRESPPKNVDISVSDCASRESGAVVKPSPMIPIDAVKEDKKSVGQEVSGIAFAGKGKLKITNTEHRNQIRKQFRKKTRNRIRNQVNIVINIQQPNPVTLHDQPRNTRRGSRKTLPVNPAESLETSSSVLRQTKGRAGSSRLQSVKLRETTGN